MKILPTSQCAGNKLEDFWRGNSNEMERGSVSDYSDVSEPTARTR